MRPTYYMTESEVTEGSTHNVTSTSSMSFGGYYGGYYGGYGGSYASVMMGTSDYETRQYSYQDPDTVVNTKVLQIETTVYRVADEKMVWYGRVVSDNPSSPKQVITDAVNATSRDHGPRRTHHRPEKVTSRGRNRDDGVTLRGGENGGPTIAFFCMVCDLA